MIGLFDAYNRAITTQYTYDPTRVVRASRAPNSYPYLYQRMEYDVWTGLYHSMSSTRRCHSESRDCHTGSI